MRVKRINGFSLMEMMVVLLIVAIIAAASAPMVTKKLSRNAGTGDSPWVFTGLNNNIAYLGDNSGQVLIGAANRPASADHAMLYIAGRNNWEHIAFGNSNNTDSMGITANPGQRSIGINRINNNLAIPQTSVMFGMNQTLNANNYSGIVAIGDSTVNGGSNSVAVGIEANARSTNAVAIGHAAIATNTETIAIGAQDEDDSGARGVNSIAIGTTALAEHENTTAVGALSSVRQTEAMALGPSASANGDHSIAIGHVRTTTHNTIAIGCNNTVAAGGSSLAIGDNANAEGDAGIAIGNGAVAKAQASIAIGSSAKVSNSNHYDSIVIGTGAECYTHSQIVLGTSDHTVYIPGNLIVGKRTLLMGKLGLPEYQTEGLAGGLYAGTPSGDAKNMKVDGKDNKWVLLYSKNKGLLSDRRLKNVGEKYTAGLAELKKLDFFHYTFKKDEGKTPHVGVMAQDLQKVFPDAVTKGEDGYLQIRFEDMFYAVINAVKELDNKIAEIVQNITDMRSTIVKQAEINEEQSKTIAEQQKNN